MRRRFMIVLLAALAALATFATAQVQNEDGTDSLVSASGRTVLSVPATTPGPLFEDTPSTVFHWAADTWNPIRFSNDLTSAAGWSGHGGTALGGQQDPFGGLTATAIVEDGANTYRSFTQSVRAGGSATYTMSFYVKPGARSWASMQMFSGPACYFNLTGDGAVGTCSFGGTGTIARASNGYYRVSVTGIGDGNDWCVLFSAAVDGQTIYQGTAGVTAATFFGPQIDLGSVAQPYRVQPTANLLTSPSAFDNAAWLLDSSGTGSLPVVTPNVAAAPDGTITADRVQFDKGAGIGTSRIRQAVSGTAPAGTVLISSVWMRTNDGTTKTVILRDALNQRVLVTVTPAWQNFSITAPGPAGLELDIMLWHLLPGPTSDTADLLLWGASATRSDMQGDVPVMNGTVPLVTTSPLFAKGSGAGRRFVGPFSTANYFRWQSATPMQFTGDHTICVAYVRNSATSNFLHMIDAGATTGWYFQDTAGTVSYREVSNSVDKGATITATTAPGAFNVLCGGRTGTTIYAKLNGSTTAATTGAAIPLSYPTDMYVGEWSGAVPLLGYVYEVWATTTAWSEASVAQIEANALANGGKGPLFPDDAGTVLHLTGDAYDGALWKAPQATLTTYGAVPYSDAWVPPISGQLQRQSYGPFTDANYFSLGSGPDVLDFAGDFSACITFKGAADYSTLPVIFGNGAYPLDGYVAMFDAGGHFKMANWDGAEVSAQTTNLAPASTLNVACFGRAASTVYAKLNLGTIASASGATAVPGITRQARLGRYNGANQQFPGAIYEAWFSTDPASDALFTKIQRRAFQHLAAQGIAVTVARSTASNAVVPNGATQTVYAVPINVASQAPDGIEVWRRSTNAITGSEDFSNAAGWSEGTAYVTTVTPDTWTAPNGTLTGDTIEFPANASARQSSAVAFAASSTWTGSCWLAAGTKTTASLRAYVVGAASGHGTACPLSLTTTPARFTCQFPILDDATPGGTIALQINGSDNTPGAIKAWGCQLEQKPYATPYIPTTTTATARSADVVSFSQAGALATAGRSPDWCVRFTVKPGAGHGWNTAIDNQGGLMLFGAGASAASGTATLMQDAAGTLSFSIYAAAGTPRTVSISGFYDAQPHDIAACAGNGTPYFVIDGVRATGLVSGSGTGIIEGGMATPIYLGLQSGWSDYLDGTIRDFQVCDRPVGACAPPAIPATTLGYFPFDRSGAFETDANTIANVTFNGVSLVDPYNVTTPWTMVGSVGQNKSSPFYPHGFAYPNGQALGAGPFAAATYYKLVGGGALGFPGGVGSMCWAYNKYTGYGTAAAVALGAFGVYNTSGWQLTDDGTFFINGAGTNRSVMSASPTLFGLNVICAGLNNNVASIKTNGGAYTSQLALISPYVPPTGDATLGWYAVNKFLNGSLYAFWASTTPPSDALFTKQIQKFLGATGSSNEVFATTRTTTAYGAAPDGPLYLWSAGVPRISCDSAVNKCGLFIEPARTNILLDSEEISTTAGRWTIAGFPSTVSIVSDQYVGPHGLTTMDKLTVTTARHAVYQVAGGGATTSFTGSAWVRADTGTQDVSVVTECNGVAVSACTCWRSDGGACSTAIFTTPERCAASANVGTTPVRLSATATCSAPTAAGVVYLSASDYVTGTGSGSMGVGLVQLELGPYASSYIPTTSSQVVRNADIASAATNPLAASNPSAWCVDATYVPESGRPWSTVENNSLWSFNTSYTLAGGRALSSINGGTLRLYSENGSAAISYAHGLAAGGSTRIAAGANLPNAWLYVNGTSVATGTPTQTATSSPLNFGASDNNASGAWGGFIRHFRLCNSMCQTCR